MDEYQRQAYLAALGVENYMPRWCLAFAPEPIACVFPLFIQEEESHFESDTQHNPIDVPGMLFNSQPKIAEAPIHIADVLLGFTQNTQEKKVLLNSVAIIPDSDTEKLTIPAFALSIWRPDTDLLIIDSRNTRLALPTEFLLNNILRSIFGLQSSSGEEDVLRWPLVENTFVSRTFNDARNALQVWLEVELDQRPAKKILLMGENAAQYLLPEDASFADSLWQTVPLIAFSSSAIIVPSLVELLQRPLLKRNLWQALQPWRHPV